MGRVESLPFDVQLLILGFLEPLDILRLRKTCKTLHRTSSERTVWTNALRRICARNTIFMPTFPIYDMSLSALEYAATASERFLRNAVNCRLLQPRSHLVTKHNDDMYREIFLVPGGRYLVTADTTRVAVWDLGIPGCSSTVTQSTQPMSSLPSPSASWVEYLLVRPNEDGRGLDIFVTLLGKSERLRLVIFRIYPSNNYPLLLKLAEAEEPRYPEETLLFWSLLRNKVIYLLDSTLTVWDYAQDTWTCIQVSGGYKHMIISESAIMLLYCDHISTWKMASLSVIRSLSSASLPLDIPPDSILKLPSLPISVDCVCECTCDWYTGSLQPLLFEFASGDALQRFEVVHENENEDIVVISLGNSKTPIHEYSRFCNDTLVCWRVHNGCVEVDITSLPSAADAIDSTVVLHGGMKTPGPDVYGSSSFCPFSGRFAYAHNSHDVNIVDYFSESLPEAYRISKMSK